MRLRGTATDGARDTDQVYVAALDEGDGTVTERLHGPRACTNALVDVNKVIRMPRRSRPVTLCAVTFPGRPQFGPVVDLAYTRKRASW